MRTEQRGLGLAAAQHVLDGHRDHRGDHDQHDRRLEVVPDEVDLAEVVAEHGDAGAPQHRADAGVEEEPLRVHPAGPGDHRDEGPHDRHEPGHHDRPVAVPVEELVGAVQVLRFQEPRVRVPEQRGAETPADVVAGHVPAERRGRQDHADQPERYVDGAVRDEQTDSEQQRVTRQDREQQPALDEHDRRGAPQRPVPEFGQQVLGVHPVGHEHGDLSKHRHRVAPISETGAIAVRSAAAADRPCTCPHRRPGRADSTSTAAPTRSAGTAESASRPRRRSPPRVRGCRPAGPPRPRASPR